MQVICMLLSVSQIGCALFHGWMSCFDVQEISGNRLKGAANENSEDW